MFEHILSQLATAQGCMERIKNNLPLTDVIAKGKAIGKAIRLINQLNAHPRHGTRRPRSRENLRALYEYMLDRLTLANVTNDHGIVAEVAGAGAQGQERLGSDRHGPSDEPADGAAALQRALDALAAKCSPRPISGDLQGWPEPRRRAPAAAKVVTARAQQLERERSIGAAANRRS